MKQINVTGDIVRIINNVEGLYSGNLRHYFRVHVTGPHIGNDYHGMRHPLHVTWVAYEIGKRCLVEGLITSQEFRALLIAALLHDYAHCGKKGDDSENIARALQAVDAFLLPTDRPLQLLINHIIKSTEFPHKPLRNNATLMEKIIRDADVGQALSDSWMQTILIGLGREMGETPLAMLKMQTGFLRSIHLYTPQAAAFYGINVIEEKCAEVQALLDIWEGSD